MSPIRDSASRITSPSEKPSKETVMSPSADDHSITPARASRPARPRDRILRVVGWVLFLAVGLAMLGLGAASLYARSGSGRERIRRLVVAQAQKSIPGLSIGRIGGDYVHDLWL